MCSEGRRGEGLKDTLIPNPLGTACFWGPGRQKTRADGHEYCGNDHEGSIITQLCDASSRTDGTHDDGKDKGNVVDPGLEGRDAFDCLEPDGDIVQEKEETGAKEEDIRPSGPDTAVGHEAWVDCCDLRLPELDPNEGNDTDAKSDKETDDSRAGPSVGQTTPLKREQHSDNGRDEEEST